MFNPQHYETRHRGTHRGPQHLEVERFRSSSSSLATKRVCVHSRIEGTPSQKTKIQQNLRRKRDYPGQRRALATSRTGSRRESPASQSEVPGCLGNERHAQCTATWAAAELAPGSDSMDFHPALLPTLQPSVPLQRKSTRTLVPRLLGQAPLPAEKAHLSSPDVSVSYPPNSNSRIKPIIF